MSWRRFTIFMYITLAYIFDVLFINICIERFTIFMYRAWGGYHKVIHESLLGGWPHVPWKHSGGGDADSSLVKGSVNQEVAPSVLFNTMELDGVIRLLRSIQDGEEGGPHVLESNGWDDDGNTIGGTCHWLVENFKEGPRQKDSIPSGSFGLGIDLLVVCAWYASHWDATKGPFGFADGFEVLQ